MSNTFQATYMFIGVGWLVNNPGSSANNLRTFFMQHEPTWCDVRSPGMRPFRWLRRRQEAGQRTRNA